jgi:hypothetical protein
MDSKKYIGSFPTSLRRALESIDSSTRHAHHRVSSRVSQRGVATNVHIHVLPMYRVRGPNCVGRPG